MSQPSGESILIVEDDEGVALLERRALERRGYRVTAAATLQAALAAVQIQAFDLIVTDYRLPQEATGLDLFAQVRALGQNVPVILVTGFSNESIVIEALRQGVRDFVPKSAEYLQYLPEAVQRVLKAVGTERELVKSEEALRQRDEQLRQVQKMEAVGQLAGGVAHDFNNLLTVILGYSEMLLLIHESDGSEDVEFLQEIGKAAERAGLLTRQLLAFSRKQVLEPIVLNLNDVIADTEKMLRRLIGEDILIRTVLAPILDHVWVDPGQIEQVLMNLAVNARDAMPQGGELTIETANVELDLDYAQSHSEVQPGHYVLLAVSDSGCGMDKATQARIFEPFFTTKEPGEGTGLGLATVYGIVTQSGGHVWVKSELGQGTTFKIYLPVKEEVVRIREPAGKEQQALHGEETVLLVEDEDSVRALSRHALQAYGYKVLEASHPLDAVQLSEAHEGEIHLLVTDVVMPQINGRRLAELLHPRRPAMKVLYISGYTNDAIVRQGILHNEVSFLQKPFTPLLLGAKVREVLNRPQI